jgi:hypothetical protein
MIAVGVDTHKSSHFAVALDDLGQLLGELAIEVCAAGYEELAYWARGVATDGQQIVFGIEGAGIWGAGLCQQLQACGCEVFEVERPRRRDRRSGKSDRIDAFAAAKRVLVREGISTPRRQGILTALRALLMAQRSAVVERTRLLNELQALRAVAPIALRERLGEGRGRQLERRVARIRGRKDAEPPERAVLAVMRDLAARSRARWPSTWRATSASLKSWCDRSIHRCCSRPAWDRSRRPTCWSVIPPALSPRRHSRAAMAPLRSQPHRARPSAIASIVAGTVKSTERSTRSPSAAPCTTLKRAPTSSAA